MPGQQHVADSEVVRGPGLCLDDAVSYADLAGHTMMAMRKCS